MKHKLFNFVLTAIIAVTLMLSVFAPVTSVAAQNINITNWEDKVYLADFAAGKKNAIFEPENPIPVKAPEEVMDALERGAYLIVIEPYKAGCGGNNPVENVNCNVGFIRSFTNWDDMRDFLYVLNSEGNPGHFGPWVHGSIKISYIREMTPDEMEASDWVMYMKGEIRVNFAENKKLPAEDPTDGLVLHVLSEAWRHGCDGNSENSNCEVGKAGKGNWQAVLNYLEEGKWTRGSIVAWPKEAVQATAVPSNTPVAPATGSVTPATPSKDGTATAQPPATLLPTQTAYPTFTAMPGDEVGGSPTDAEAALPPAAETPREGGVGGLLLGLLCLVLIVALGWAFWYFLIHLPAKNSELNEQSLAEQPAEEGDLGNSDALLAPAEEHFEQPVEESVVRRRRHQG